VTLDRLKVVAVASSEETRAALQAQLTGIDFVDHQGVLIELSDAVRNCQKEQPDVIMIDMTGRELDTGLFIEAMTLNPAYPCVVFALHRNLDHQIILDAVRRGAKEFIQYPEDPKSLDAALRKQLAFVSRFSKTEKTQDKGKVITVFSAKGGAGCSTVAVNLAHELHQLTREPVALFDLDQVFSNTAVMLNLRPNYALGDIAQTPSTEVDDALLRKITLKHESGLELMVGSKSVLDENELIPPELLARVMDYLEANYSYVVIDLPTHVLDAYHQYLAERADHLLLVSGLDIPGLYRSRQYIDLAKRYLEEGKLKLVLNRWNLRGAYGLTNKNLEEEFRFPVYCRLPNDWELNVEANSLGCVLAKVNQSADLVKAFRKVASLISGQELPETVSPKRQGLLSKIFSLNFLKKGDERHAAG
jgi:pilus assembly protein CpaE